MTGRDDDDDRAEGGKILRFPRPAGAAWSAPPDDDPDEEDEARRFTRAVVRRHVDPRVAEDLLPLLLDPGERDAALAALSSVLPPEVVAQVVAFRALDAADEASRIAAAREALTLDPENLDARVVLAERPEEDGDSRRRILDEAIAVARHRAVTDPTPDVHEPVLARTRSASLARALVARSRTLRADGRTDEALRDAAEAAVLDPDAVAPRIEQAATLLLRGEGPPARRALAGVEGDERADGVVLWGLVLAWFLEGDLERARDHLALARRSAPRAEAAFVSTDDFVAGSDDAIDALRPAWISSSGARGWLLGQGEPIGDALDDAFSFAEPLPRDREGRLDADLAEAYGEGLLQRFLLSEEARELLAGGGSTALVQWTLLDSLAHLDTLPADWTEADLDELLLRQVPEHLELPMEDARDELRSMSGFLRFLGRAHGLGSAARLEAHLDDAFADAFDAACRGLPPSAAE